MATTQKSNRRIKTTSSSKETQLKKTVFEKEDEPNFYKCSSCGTPYEKLDDNFPASQSELYAGLNYHLPICKKCMDTLFEHYTNAYGGNEDDAIRRICELYDMYYNASLLSASRKITKNRSRIHTYISRANLTQYKGKTYDSTLDEERNNAITSLEDLDEIKEKSDINVTKNSIKIWGFGFSPEDYEFLNNQFSDWRSKVVIEGKAKESLVRELCMLKLQQNKALLGGKIDLYTKLTETYQKTLDRASLTPKIEEAADKAGELPMGMMIDRFENENPIPEPMEEWKDVDGIIHMFIIYFLGHLCKMLNIKNKYSKMYEDEMAKYRVEIPELEEANDEEVFDFLVNGSGDG